MDAAKNSPKKKPRAKSGATGPRSAAGKAKSSSNARTHGATSNRWLSEPERESFESNLAELRAQYPSANPLVKMQIERIARLKVQLERIQDVIDASFAAARARTDPMSQAMEQLKLTDPEKGHIAATVLGHETNTQSIEYLDLRVMDVALEVTESDRFELLTTHDDFLRKLPRLCAYILEQALERGESLEDFVASRQVALPGAKRPIFRVRISNPYPGGKAGETPKPELMSVSVETLRGCAAWFSRQLWLLRLATLKFRGLQPLTEAIEGEVTPDLDKLDRLMRYQTTINRQLSSAVGELLALSKV